MVQTPIHGIEVFLTIIRAGSLSAAARVLGVGAPAVSLQLKALEERLDVDLIIRTTRKIEMTDAGRILYETAGPALRDMHDAVKKTREVGKSLNGTLKLSLSRGAYVAAIAPVLPMFLADNPGVNLDLSWNEELVDINREGFHAGIRLGDVLSPDMTAVRVTRPIATAFTAAPSYLERAGRPEHPRDLLAHSCIRYKLPTAKRIAPWKFFEAGQDTVIDPPARLIFDNVIGVIQAAREGHGIGWSMHATVDDYLGSGELESILVPYARKLPPFYLYYPEQNKRVECLRLLVDALISHRDRAV